MAEPWLPAVSWEGAYPGPATLQKSVQVGRTVRKKRSAKQHKVEALAESIVSFSDVDLSGIVVHTGGDAKRATPRQDAVSRHDVTAVDGAHADGSVAKNHKRSRIGERAAGVVEPAIDIAKSSKLPNEKSAKLSGVLEEHSPAFEETERVPLPEKKKKKRKNKFKAEDQHFDLATIDSSGNAGVHAKDTVPTKKKRKVALSTTAPSLKKPDEGTASPAQKKPDKKAKRADTPPATARTATEAAAAPQSTEAKGALPGASLQASAAVHGSDPRTSTAVGGKPTSKLGKMRLQLEGGRFRMLNEKLYTSDGQSALTMMQANPELFDAYHKGFHAQTQGWQTNPVDIAIKWLRSKPEGWVVADFGCGEAQLARELAARNTVHSFDLVSRNERVVACNMASVPLQDASCDAVVFSLALMGTDYPAFLAEARRVLKRKGFLWIAEVRSRFVPDGADAEDFAPFLGALGKLGFALLKQDAGNRMFVVWLLRKASDDPEAMGGIKWPTLKPCIYKRR